ncbi:heme o synthase [Persicobacter psychrovividus]|uniref:Protoheme IX farnesyltransferase n=1 Tax=Persicobacter psychrovividus TaxID=387638 RepID=A0ABN6L9X8_9BACT|nr:protoheme IX farnesyltransferase [Persicobacter psychrovividus]
MISSNPVSNRTFSMLIVKDLMALLKARLSLLVAFSSAFGYAMAMRGEVNWETLLMLSLGGFLVSGASITLNQIQEKEYDLLMKRTENRPMAQGRLTDMEALLYSGIVGTAGLVLLVIYTNPLTVILSVISLVLYAFVYTPLKRVGPVAVFVGAIPGALPPLLGWTAATGEISLIGIILFGIQFFWQFPHFWAIAWVADEDYKKAGFKLLPVNGKKDMETCLQIITYTLFLIPIGLLPARFGITGINSALITTVCGVLFLAQTIQLMRYQDRKSALRIMFGSFIYLPIVQLSLLFDLL